MIKCPRATDLQNFQDFKCTEKLKTASKSGPCKKFEAEWRSKQTKSLKMHWDNHLSLRTVRECYLPHSQKIVH